MTEEKSELEALALVAVVDLYIADVEVANLKRLAGQAMADCAADGHGDHIRELVYWQRNCGSEPDGQKKLQDALQACQNCPHCSKALDFREKRHAVTRKRAGARVRLNRLAAQEIERRDRQKTSEVSNEA